MMIESEPLIRRYARKMRLALEDGYPRTASDYASRIKDLMRAPEAVVRCKDCKWYLDGERVSNDIWCYKIAGDREGVSITTDPDDFCPYGERKEEVTPMNWKKFLGDALYEKLLALCADRNVTIASAVRTAIAEYVRKERK